MNRIFKQSREVIFDYEFWPILLRFVFDRINYHRINDLLFLFLLLVVVVLLLLLLLNSVIERYKCCDETKRMTKSAMEQKELQ